MPSEPSNGAFAARRRGASSKLLRVLHVLRPARVVRQVLALFQNQFLEFLDPQILNQELDARAAAIFLLAARAKTRAIACAERQQFLRRNEGVEQFRLVGNGAQAAADIHFKAALFLSVFDSRDGDHAQVVHVGQAAGVLRAAAERRLEFPAEILAVRMAQQKFGQRPRVRA